MCSEVPQGSHLRLNPRHSSCSVCIEDESSALSVVWTHLRNDAAFNADISRAENIRLNMIDETWSNFVTNPPRSSEFTTPDGRLAGTAEDIQFVLKFEAVAQPPGNLRLVIQQTYPGSGKRRSLNNMKSSDWRQWTTDRP